MILYLYCLLCIFILGLLLGSFANVCIYRIPIEESIVTPRSHCTKCNTMIRWYDNIPIISYLLLTGKCRQCGERISLRYPMVELAEGILFLLVGVHFFLQPATPVYLYFSFALLVVTMIDYDCQIIPDFFSLSLIVVGLTFASFNPQLGGLWKDRLINSFAGCLLGGGILFAVGFIGEKVMKKEAMGGGDVKLLAGIGAMVGWEKTLFALFVASLIGSIVGLSLIAFKKMNKRDYIPFGPFLAAGGYLSLFFHRPIEGLMAIIQKLLLAGS